MPIYILHHHLHNSLEEAILTIHLVLNQCLGLYINPILINSRVIRKIYYHHLKLSIANPYGGQPSAYPGFQQGYPPNQPPK